MVAERRFELLISRLSIECFQPPKLLRTKLFLYGPNTGAEKRIRTADLLYTGQALFQPELFRPEKMVRTAGPEPAMNWV